ncbi:MAG: hypothetical protein PWP23_2236 [Candidatus Sumerlaeota bacterium]|nr:hypothetical protein [Candidatus Sumerlaeota bacterium]
MRYPSLTLPLAAGLMLALAACGANKPEVGESLDDLTILKVPGRGQGMSGYNEPLDWQKGIGVRAVARGDVLMISVKNRTKTAILVEPEAFRLITPDHAKPYGFDRERDDLSGFVPRRLEPEQSDLFTVQLREFDDLIGNAVVFNYPPAGVLMRVFVEPVGA